MDKLRVNRKLIYGIIAGGFVLMSVNQDKSKIISQKNIPVEVYWIDDKSLYVQIGDLIVDHITPEDAYDRFSDNELIISKLNNLLNTDTNSYIDDSDARIEYFNAYEGFDNEIDNAGVSSDLVFETDGSVDNSSIDYITNSDRQETPIKVDIDKIKEEIEVRLDEIIAELGLEQYDDAMTKLRNCCLIQKYIVDHNSYDDNIMIEKEGYSEQDIIILDLYNAVVKHNGVCTSNALMFKKLAERVGVKAEVVGLYSNEDGAMHTANLVELDGEYYFFDSTLETTIYDLNKDKTGGDLILCCAGLGSDTYCQYYSPQVVLPDDPLGNVSSLPENISRADIPNDIVNSMIISTNKINI